MTNIKRTRVYLDTSHYVQRIRHIQQHLRQQELDGLLLLNAANVMWACGFFHIPNERPLGLYVPADGPPTLFVPFLEKENAEAHAIAEVRCYWEFPGTTPAEVWMMEQIPADRVAVDGAGYITFQQMQALKPALCLDDGIAHLRYIKSAAEIALTELAAAYSDHGLTIAREAVADGLTKGITELDVVQIVQSETVAKMRTELDDLINFYRGAVALTAHTGPRAAQPHGQPGPVAIQPGDTLIVGIGAKVGGYHAESGCTYIIGEPDAEQRHCLETTWACDEAALQALTPGRPCAEVNEIALSVLRAGGYSDHIRHRIGHGLGVEGHEAPWLSDGDNTPIQPGMIFSNEPGIYRPGVDGYRIIDTMLVTDTGGRRLSRYLSDHGPDDRVIEP